MERNYFVIQHKVPTGLVFFSLNAKVVLINLYRLAASNPDYNIANFTKYAVIGMSNVCVCVTLYPIGDL
jgi:hypothetical protein